MQATAETLQLPCRLVSFMGGVFISYRRDDTAGYAGRLYDALTAHFGRDLVFIDVDSIRAGQNFVDVIDGWIASCSVVIVLIGKGWLNSADARGRRLDDPQDFVRLEVASALRQISRDSRTGGRRQNAAPT